MDNCSRFRADKSGMKAHQLALSGVPCGMSSVISTRLDIVAGCGMPWGKNIVFMAADDMGNDPG